MKVDEESFLKVTDDHEILEDAHFEFTISPLNHPKLLKMLRQLSDEESQILMVGI